MSTFSISLYILDSHFNISPMPNIYRAKELTKTFKMLSVLHCKLGLLQKSSQSLGGCSQSVVVKTQIQAVRLCMYQGKPTYDTHRKGSTSPKILQVTCKIQPVISAG